MPNPLEDPQMPPPARTGTGPTATGGGNGTADWIGRHAGWVLLAITLLGLALRVWGIRWGAPDRIDLHPDEIDYVIKHARKVSFSSPDPGFLNYPSFLIYLTALASGALRRLGLLTEVWQVHLVGRSWSALFGTAVVPAVFLLARELGARAPGALLAALWAALLPYHVWESHVAVTDVPMTFWTVVTLLAAVRLVRTGRRRDWLLAGAALGLATGSKYTAALAASAIVLGALLGPHPWRRRIEGLALAAAASLAACFIVTPFTFIRFGDFLAAMAFERGHTTGGHYGFSVPADGWWYRRWLYQLAAGWPYSMGFALYGSAAAGTAWAIATLDRRKAVLLVFGAVFFAVTGSWVLTPLRYYLPLLVCGALLAGLWQGAWLGSTSRWRRTVAAAAVAVTAAYTGVYTWQTTARYSRETRVEAQRWLQERLGPGGRLLILGWRRYLAMPGPGSGVEVVRDSERVLADLERTASFDLIEASSLVYGRHYRHGDPGGIGAYERLRDPSGDYRLVRRFESDFLNKRLYVRLDPMFEGYFVSPTLEFYEPVARP